MLVSGLVEWQFPHRNGTMMPFDIYTNLILEEALESKQKNVKIKIHNETYTADLKFKKAISANGRKEVELLRKDLKGECSHSPDSTCLNTNLFFCTVVTF